MSDRSRPAGDDPSEAERPADRTADRGDPPTGLYRQLVEASNDCLLALGRDGMVDYANAASERVFGHDAATLEGSRLASFVPEDRRQHRVVLELFHRDDVAADWDAVEVPIVDADGSERWVSLSLRESADGDVIVGTARDVTDRRGRKQELERYETIIETVDDGIYVLDSNFTITDVNQAVVSMTGYSRDELVGSHATLLTDESVIDRAAELSVELLESKREAGTLTAELTTAEGETIPIETRFSLYPFDDESYGQVGVVRDITDRKHFEETLTALHDATRGLLEVETAGAISERLVDTATEVIDLASAAIYLFDEESNVLRSSAAFGGAGAGAVSAPTVDPGEGPVWRAFVEDEATVVESDGSGTDIGLPGVVAMVVPLGDYGAFVAASESAAAFDDDTRTLVDLLAASAETALARVERAATLRERDWELQRRNRRLRQLDRVNAIIREIDQALVGADTREEIDASVCERLVAADRFSFAWIGVTDPTEGVLRPSAWAGDERGYLDAVTLDAETGSEPAVRAAREGETVSVENVAEGLRQAPWRSEALSREHQSFVSVPLQYGTVNYGVLTVVADEPAAFDEMVSSVLAELGETIARAVNAVEAKQALLTDSVVALEFLVPAPADCVCRLATAADRRLTVTGVIPQAGDLTRVFFTAECEPAALLGLEDTSVAVESVSLVADHDGESLFEATVTGPTVGATLVDLGAVVQELWADVDGVHAEVELPGSADVRSFVASFTDGFPDVELLGRRRRERPARTRAGFRASLDDRLTERQREVLQFAYLSGFFESPRERTGQEIAEALGLSQPTVNRHLRASERKLLSMLFEGR